MANALAPANMNHSVSAEPLMVQEPNPGPGFSEEDLIYARQQPNKVVTTRPPLLGYTSIVLIIINRMIGTGIFRTPTTLAHGTHSVAYSLLLWAAGAIVAICGAHVFAEFGMTVPRLEVDGEDKQSVARNGGEKNYLEYMIKKPKYLATCLYGIPFIVLATPAGNSLIFANSVLQATGAEPSDAGVRGLAIGVASFACLLHTVWRSGGIYLNNFFGAIKVVILLVMSGLGLAYAAGAFGGSNSTASHNLSIHNSTHDPLNNAFGYAEAFLAVLFAYGGFNQATYVLGEIDHPRRKFKPTTLTTACFVGILYILVNLSYMMVVPEADQIKAGPDTVAALFFVKIFGAHNAVKIQNSFMAFSSFGNILVQTFTAARVKQEIAKEGILPFTKFLADNKSLTLRFLRSKTPGTSDATPVGAFLLHWSWTVILILASIPSGSSNDAYRIYVNLYSFVVDAIFGFAIGLSIIFLRLRKASHWSTKSTSNKYISFGTAFVFTIANCFPLVAIWIRPSGNSDIKLPVKWWATGTIGAGLIGFALLYWAVLYYIIPRIIGRSLDVKREASYVRPHGYWIIWHEITSVNWRTKSQN